MSALARRVATFRDPPEARPAFRRRGIAEAQLATAFAEFYRRGERLYQNAGMKVFFEAIVWEKELRRAD